MPIVSSLIVSATVQASGDRSVHERHADHAGRTYDVSYFAPASMDIGAVLAARAEKIGAEIDAREAVAAEAMQFEMPVPWVDFIDRFTAQERIAVRAARATDPIIDDFLDLGEKRGAVLLSSPRLAGALDYMIGTGLIAADRKAEVLA
jgi:hypothetical protein